MPMSGQLIDQGRQLHQQPKLAIASRNRVPSTGPGRGQAGATRHLANPAEPLLPVAPVRTGRKGEAARAALLASRTPDA